MLQLHYLIPKAKKYTVNEHDAEISYSVHPLTSKILKHYSSLILILASVQIWT
jgi:hypothetical protein